MVKTIQYVKDFLENPNISDIYAQKFIDGSHGDDSMLDELLFAEKAKRNTTAAVREVC
ncbi:MULTISPECIES: hypothetical protein [Staphylococcus]|uniref:hypothetical protein n=1 Tax=Staphylococcus TaxID=1279 RepID=UPI000412FBD7|nr:MULTISPECIES: hypothetical protein [Staphylococcus]MDW3871223.1 hypothetical protein [Staphylococcus saprophyticus]MDW4026271.1 hypothetical protein [Staphylococcus saprophyticus]MDW4058673.1 hypothetical protein [Staphylococcus saprophyticus]MDW4066508.1 hypothetical protein [Staphylococcus saprophyticus]MDW4369497.1 hypothetical protein [Staphylococcus saprophyticus]